MIKMGRPNPDSHEFTAVCWESLSEEQDKYIDHLKKEIDCLTVDFLDCRKVIQQRIDDNEEEHF